MNKKNYLLLIGIVGIHLVLLMVLEFTAWPEMTLWPYLINQGWLSYRDIAIAHTPLMLFDLSIFYKIFGVGILQLKMFTWILILLLDGLVFFVSKKLWNTKTAFIALATFAIWNLFFDGNGLWFDLYMGILAFCSFYFVRRKKWFWGGFFWALAVISKQTAIWFLLPILLEMVKNLQQHYLSKQNIHYRLSVKKLLKFAGGVFAVAIPFVVALALFGILSDFWNWAIKYGIFILPKAQGQVQLPAIKTLIVSIFPFLVFIPLLAKRKSRNINLFVWALAGGLGTYPRFEYFHILPALPFLAIATAHAGQDLFMKKNILIKIFTTIYIFGSLYLLGNFFIRNLNKEIRFYEKDVADIVTFVKYNSTPGDKIFILNWWDNIYALTETVPAIKPWVPQLSWYMETPGIQEKMIEDLISHPPKLIVYNPYTTSGLSSYIPEKVYDYIMNNYRVNQSVGDIKILTK